MFKLHNHQVSIMVSYAIMLHLVWSAILVFDVSAVNATALHALYRYIHSPLLLAAVLLTATIMASVGLMTNSAMGAFLLLPQQALLMMSAAGAVEAMWLSQFADGVIRPWGFIAADQVYSVLAAIGHTAAITAHAMRAER